MSSAYDADLGDGDEETPAAELARLRLARTSSSTSAASGSANANSAAPANAESLSLAVYEESTSITLRDAGYGEEDGEGDELSISTMQLLQPLSPIAPLLPPSPFVPSAISPPVSTTRPSQIPTSMPLRASSATARPPLAPAPGSSSLSQATRSQTSMWSSATATTYPSIIEHSSMTRAPFSLITTSAMSRGGAATASTGFTGISARPTPLYRPLLPTSTSASSSTAAGVGAGPRGTQASMLIAASTRPSVAPPSASIGGLASLAGRPPTQSSLLSPPRTTASK